MKKILQKLLKLKFQIILVILGLAVFLPSYNNSFVWDDPLQILDNLPVHSISNIGTFFTSRIGFYYKPLMQTVFAAIFTIWGANVIPFHIFQVSLHIINAVLVFLFFRYFLNKYWSFFLSLIFLIHPMQIEPVIYIASLQDSLFFFFGILALWLISRKSPAQPLKFRFKLLILLISLLSLFSKESGLLFVLTIPLYAFIYQKKNWIVYSCLTGTSFFTYIILRLIVAQTAFIKNNLIPINNAEVGERLLTIPSEIFYYFKTFFYPKDLAIDLNWVIKSASLSNFYLPLLVLLLLTAGFIVVGWFLKHRSQKLFKSFLFFGIWIVVGIGIHLNVIPLDMTVADRWFYFPMVGLLGVIGSVFSLIKVENNKWIQRIMIILGIIIIVILSYRTYFRTKDWKDAYTLYSRDILISENSHVLNNDLGIELSKRGDIDGAIAHFKKATELAPTWDAWNNLGAMYFNKQDYKDAISSYDQAIKIDWTFKTAYLNKMLLLIQAENMPDLKQFSEDSLSKFPDETRFAETLALAQNGLGDKDAALKTALDVNQKNPSKLSSYLVSQLIQGKTIERNWIINYYNQGQQ